MTTCGHSGCQKLAKEGEKFCDFHKPKQSQIDKAFSGNAQQAPAQEPSIQNGSSLSKQAHIMKSCFKEAQNMFRELDDEKVFPKELAFGPEDVRSVAVSLFIDKMRRYG